MQITLDVAELSNGIRMPYAERGPRDGIPVVLLHGMTDSWRSFEPVLPHLPESIRAFAVTQRGHGDASRPGSYALSEFADDVARFMDAVGVPSAIVAGSSMGSIVASRFAIDHGPRTDGLVLMAAAASWSHLAGGFAAELDALTDPIDADWFRGFQESTLARTIPPDYLDLVVGESGKLSTDTLRAVFAGTCLAEYASELGAITAPALVVWGERDVYCPRSQQDALVTAIPGARLIVHEGAGHAFHWEDPERIAGEIAAFAAEMRG